MRAVNLIDVRDHATATARRRLGSELGDAFRGAMRDPARLIVLWRVFSAEEPVPTGDLVSVTSDAFVRDALEHDLLIPVDIGDEQDWVRCSLSIAPLDIGGDLVLVAADHSWDDDDPEAVIGPGMASHTLRALIPDGAWASVADLGCGSGALAVALASDEGRCVAIDINQRAVSLTELTAALNRVEVAAEVGDLTDGAPGTFDLVIANPPFVLGRPRSRTTFRDSDDASAFAGLAHDIAPMLSEGGLGIYLSNWAYSDSTPQPLPDLAADLSAVPRCDILIIERARVAVREYVGLWTDDDDVAREWASAMHAGGITHLGTGAVVVRAIAADDDADTNVSVATPYDTPLDDLAGLIADWLQAQDDARSLDADSVVVAAPYDVLDDGHHVTLSSRDGLRLAITADLQQARNLMLPLLEKLNAPCRIQDAASAVGLLRPTPHVSLELNRIFMRTKLVKYV